MVSEGKCRVLCRQYPKSLEESELALLKERRTAYYKKEAWKIILKMIPTSRPTIVLAEELGVESFYEANEENVKKAGFAAAVALFLLLVYCVWKRLRRRRIGRGGTSRGGKSAAEKNTREGREEEEEKEDNAEERE